ncbi:MAG: GAF domain-containing sensor histidine kinase [Chloroflexi bacterium]|nr:GAF domain-containing sensor histidine kinase [Chloroflexota bacterium]
MVNTKSTSKIGKIAELERRQKVAASLRETLAILNTNLPLEKLLNYIVNQACPLLNADAAAIYHLQVNGILTIQGLVGLSNEYIKYGNIPLGKMATGNAALTKKPIFVYNTRELLDEPGITSDLVMAVDKLSKEFSSLLSVPIEIREENYGSLTLYYRKQHAVTEEEISLARDFSNQAALAIDNARMRTQIKQDAVTEERNRLARELHDSVTQNLFSANLIADTIPVLIQRNPQKALEGLDELRLLTKGALAEMRSLLLELRPNALEDTSLEDLFHQLAETASGRLRKPVSLEIKGQAFLPSDIRLTFYRIAQEALNNIIKHAEAETIKISLTLTPDEVDGTCTSAVLVIQDDGCGFKDIPDSAIHLGFCIMKERAQNAGADLEIKSKVNIGTTIQLSWKAKDEEFA